MSSNGDGGLSKEAKDIARDHAKVKFPATEAVMLEDLQQTLRLSRDVARAHQKQCGELEGLPEKEGESMIHVGDYYAAPSQRNHGLAAPQPGIPAPSQPPTEPAWKTWAKRLGVPLAAAGLGAGGLAGWNALTGPVEQPPAVERQAEPGRATPYTRPEPIGPGMDTEVIDGLPEEE